MDLVRAPAGSRLTRQQYLRLDTGAEEARFEYDGSRAYMMAGASLEHNQISADLSTALNVRLRDRGCNVSQSDMRVRMEGGYTYPDVVMLCREPEVTDEDPPSLLNPELLVEVLSASTETRDCTWKLDRYLEVESLQECWLVETSAPRIRQYVRQAEDAWTRRALHGTGAVLASFGLEVPLAEIYRRVF